MSFTYPWIVWQNAKFWIDVLPVTSMGDTIYLLCLLQYVSPSRPLFVSSISEADSTFICTEKYPYY